MTISFPHLAQPRMGSLSLSLSWPSFSLILVTNRFCFDFVSDVVDFRHFGCVPFKKKRPHTHTKKKNDSNFKPPQDPPTINLICFRTPFSRVSTNQSARCSTLRYLPFCSTWQTLCPSTEKTFFDWILLDYVHLFLSTATYKGGGVFHHCYWIRTYVEKETNDLIEKLI